MKITDFIKKNNIIVDLKGKNKLDILTELVTTIVNKNPILDKNRMIEALLEREKLGSTGIGEGVAIPHGKVESLEKLIACFGRSSNGVDFRSIDNKPTHLFVVLLAPMNSTGVHLRALARISRLLKESSLRKKLIEAKDASEIYNIIETEDNKL